MGYRMLEDVWRGIVISQGETG